MRFLGRWTVVIPIGMLLIATGCSGSDASTTASAPAVASSSAPAGGAGGVNVTLEQWAITPSATTVPAGPVTFTVTNAGTIPHEFVVLHTKTQAGDFSITSFEGETQRFDEDTAGKNVGETGDMAVGATATLTIDLAPGHYAFVCNLPAHYGQGMHTDFTVT
ncbi:MAG: hypothetical protein QOE28_2890 [Solirubrobacteraceae bacterium]|nr:hypothetical protein [Solirubrobacteraceae bacterium]